MFIYGNDRDCSSAITENNNNKDFGCSDSELVFMPRHKKWRGIMLYPPNF